MTPTTNRLRKALLVGVNYYDDKSWRLKGSVRDANQLEAVLGRHGDGSINFTCELLTAGSKDEALRADELREKMVELFADPNECVLFYFSGHGYVGPSGGYLLTSESKSPTAGVSMHELSQLAAQSKAANRIVILDCCQAGGITTSTGSPDVTLLTEGTTILTSSTSDQSSFESPEGGVFTNLLCEALQGAAAGITGEITPGSVYAHIDRALGAWQQRPIFKTNVQEFISLRRVNPSVPLEELRRLPEFFPAPGFEFALDPSFEPRDEGRTLDMLPSSLANVRIFGILQRFNRQGLLVPNGTAHMWNAAMESKTCRLTASGEYYRKLIVEKLL